MKKILLLLLSVVIFPPFKMLPQQSFQEKYLSQGRKTEYGSIFDLKWLYKNNNLDLHITIWDEVFFKVSFCSFSINHGNYSQFKLSHQKAYEKFKEWYQIAQKEGIREYEKAISGFYSLGSCACSQFSHPEENEFHFVFKIKDGTPYFCYKIDLSISYSDFRHRTAYIYLTDKEAQNFTQYLDNTLLKQKQHMQKSKNIDNLFN